MSSNGIEPGFVGRPTRSLKPIRKVQIHWSQQMYLCNLCLLTHYWLNNNVMSDTRILGLHLITNFWVGSTPVSRIITWLLDYLHKSRNILLFVCEINTKICTSCNLQYHQNFATPLTRGLDRRIPEQLFGREGPTDWSPLKDIASRDFSLWHKSKNNNKKKKIMAQDN